MAGTGEGPAATIGGGDWIGPPEVQGKPGAEQDAQPRFFLSRRQREVLALAAQGLLAREIAAQLGIATDTVTLHVERARERLGARSRTQAVALALAAGLISLPGRKADLTDRQREMVALVAQGLTEREIAARLWLALSSVKGCLLRARRRLGARNQTQAVAMAVAAGLISISVKEGE